LNFRHEVLSRHLVYLRIADVCRWGGRRPQDAAPGPAPEHPTPAPSSTSGSTYSGLDPFAGLYIHTTKLAWGIPIVTFTLRTFTGASSSSSSASSPSRDSSDEYPEIGASACGKSVEDTVSSLWWPQIGIGPATALVGIPLLEDQRRLVPKP
jgi:hypothetical protein